MLTPHIPSSENVAVSQQATGVNGVSAQGEGMQCLDPCLNTSLSGVLMPPPLAYHAPWS